MSSRLAPRFFSSARFLGAASRRRRVKLRGSRSLRPAGSESNFHARSLSLINRRRHPPAFASGSFNRFHRLDQHYSTPQTSRVRAATHRARSPVRQITLLLSSASWKGNCSRSFFFAVMYILGPDTYGHAKNRTGSRSELSMAPFCVTRSNPIHQLTYPTFLVSWGPNFCSHPENKPQKRFPRSLICRRQSWVVNSPVLPFIYL